MKYLELLSRLENITHPTGDLQDCEITANSINGISFLIIKDGEGRVFDCIILQDKHFEAVKELREELGIK